MKSIVLRSLQGLLCAAGLVIPLAQAGTADISNVPMGTASITAKPNILFILDDSGSMAWDFMPDEMGYWTWSEMVGHSEKYGYWSSQCNGVAFNPNEPYAPPIKADGTSYANASLSAARRDGYNGSSSTADLSSNYYYSYSGTQTAMNWTYASNGDVDTSTTFYKECMSDIGSWPGSLGTNKFTKVNVSSLTATQKQSYANWYSYYRTRQLLMRTGAGRAFYELDSNYRVGFTVISDSGVTGSNFLDVKDYDSTQKSSFFSQLYSATAYSSTPLRGALSKAGRYYAKTVDGQSYDPMQYSCQRSYALLSTDGYWNTPGETWNYGPYKLDNSTEVGQQDADEVRPMQDGSASVVTTVTTTTNTNRTTSTGTATVSTVYERTKVTVGTPSCGRNNNRLTSTTQVQRRTDTATGPYTSVTDISTTTTRTVVATNGTTTSDTTTTSSPSTTTTPTMGTPTSSTTGTWSNYGSATTGCTSASAGTSYSPDSNGSQVGSSAAWAGSPSNTSTTLTVGPNTSSTTSSTGGSSNSLADVAEYYYKTDLRSDLANNIKPVGLDTAPHQHLTTYTLGLGLRGTLAYDPSYLTQTSGDYIALKNGTKQWPTPSGTLGGDENATHIDDLWHAAVNGRGRYFSATSPTTLATSLSTTLGEIKAVYGSSSAAATSTLKPVAGDRWVFLPSYVTGTNTSSWYGDVRAFQFQLTGNTLTLPSDTSAGKEVWSAKDKLEARTAARLVYMNSGGSLVAFNYTNMSTAQKAYFDNRCTTANPLLSQCSSLNATAKTKVTGANLVSYLAGDKSLYLNATDPNYQVFRTRSYLMGDVVNASPIYVGKPPFSYADAGYATFVSTQANRTKALYVAANDGMLHAFKVGTDISDSTGGTELWAFVPSAAMPEMWRLAGDDYDNNHRPFVDASPTIGDVYDSVNSRWRTILVGGLGGGGRGYYALDVTDPTNPALLWEFADTNLGLTYGNPLIAKNKAGKWVVIFSSGINNVSSGDGIGRIYVRDAVTGQKLSGDTVGEISTGAGSIATPSNLVKLEGWVSKDTDNTALRIYGGDMLGNLWRFDFDDVIAPAGKEALQLGQALGTNGSTIQPITVRPQLNEISVGGNKIPVISFGTGRYLGTTDLSDTTLQSIYTVKDSLGSTGLGSLQSTGAAMVKQTLGSDRKITSPAAIDWTAKNGWFVNLDVSSKERVHVDGTALNPGQVAFASTVPGGDICTPAGVSYLYQFDLLNGTVLKVDSYNTMIVGVSAYQAPNGDISAIASGLDGGVRESKAPPGTGGGAVTVKRTSWRELID